MTKEQQKALKGLESSLRRASELLDRAWSEVDAANFTVGVLHATLIREPKEQSERKKGK